MKMLICMVAVLLTACADRSSSLPPGVAGIMHIDAGTEFVFSTIPSRVGGACKGWNTVSVQKPGQGSTGIVDLMCWREVGGLIHTATEEKENPGAYPMSRINR